MVRLIPALVLIAAAVVLLVSVPAARRWIYLLLGLIAIYAILKLTGVIDAWVPSRHGVS